MHAVIGQDMKRARDPDNRQKPGQVELELWKCNNLGTQGDLEISGCTSWELLHNLSGSDRFLMPR